MFTSFRLTRYAFYSFAVSMTILISAAIIDFEDETPVSMAMGVVAALGGVGCVLLLMIASIVWVIGAGLREGQRTGGER